MSYITAYYSFIWDLFLNMWSSIGSISDALFPLKIIFYAVDIGALIAFAVAPVTILLSAFFLGFKLSLAVVPILIVFGMFSMYSKHVDEVSLKTDLRIENPSWSEEQVSVEAKARMLNAQNSKDIASREDRVSRESTEQTRKLHSEKVTYFNRKHQLRPDFCYKTAWYDETRCAAHKEHLRSLNLQTEIASFDGSAWHFKPGKQQPFPIN